MPAMSAPVAFSSSSAAFFGGVKTAVTSVFLLVLAGTYIGIGALAHDFGLSSWWLALSTVLVWAAPAQVILISAVTTGAALFEIALAVTLSAIRLFPMVVALLPVLRGPTHAPARPAAADAFHLGQHVGRIAAPAAEHRASMAHSVLQRPVGRLHGYGGRVRLCRLLSGGRIAAAACRRTFVPDADVVPDVDGAQRTHDDRQTWRWYWDCCLDRC